MSGEVTSLSMLELGAGLAAGTFTSVEATQACLDQIAKVDPRVRAFVRVDAEGALTAARASDARRKAGAISSAIDGVPIALKDNIDALGLPTTAGSRVLEGYVPPSDATVTALLRAAGAPILGKLNLDEFAMGSSTETGVHGATHNPYDLTRTPGGSSGGPAAAVASRQVFGALGTDTGGSIRQPASLSNVVGLKPTYGRVSRRGVVAFASSLDQVGSLTRTVADAAALLELIGKKDDGDATSSEVAAAAVLPGLEKGVQGLRIGLPREYFVDGMQPEVERAVRDAAQLFERLGAQIVDVSLPHTRHALAVYYVIAPSEASSNLARYDGVRYGRRAKDVKSLRELYLKSRSEGFGAEVKRRIMLGTFALSAGYHDAYYVKAQQVRTLIRRDFDEAFTQVDVLLSATSPVVAWPLGAKLDDPVSMYLMDVLTLPCNLAGLPGVSVPCAFSTDGLPIGLQLLGRAFDEATLLRTARAFERETQLARRAPTLAPA